MFGKHASSPSQGGGPHMFPKRTIPSRPYDLEIPDRVKIKEMIICTIISGSHMH